MCDECFSFICPGNCPESDEYSAEFGPRALNCSVCSSPIYPEEEYICTNNETICCECVNDFDTFDILEVSGSADVCELLSAAGLTIKKA